MRSTWYQRRNYPGPGLPGPARPPSTRSPWEAFLPALWRRRTAGPRGVFQRDSRPWASCNTCHAVGVPPCGRAVYVITSNSAHMSTQRDVLWLVAIEIDSIFSQPVNNAVLGLDSCSLPRRYVCRSPRSCSPRSCSLRSCSPLNCSLTPELREAHDCRPVVPANTGVIKTHPPTPADRRK